jgi:hypothetical protein
MKWLIILCSMLMPNGEIECNQFMSSETFETLDACKVSAQKAYGNLLVGEMSRQRLPVDAKVYCGKPGAKT